MEKMFKRSFWSWLVIYDSTHLFTQAAAVKKCSRPSAVGDFPPLSSMLLPFIIELGTGQVKSGISILHRDPQTPQIPQTVKK
jgi:hypothetical protein